MLNRDQIMEILPHRPPFLMIDEVTSLEPGLRAEAKKYVSADEYYFAGHFPGNPVMPGVLIVEALAQAGAVAVLAMPEFRGKTAYFGGIRNARFRRMVRPGDTLSLTVELGALRGGIGSGTARAVVGNEDACTCEITFIVR